MNREQLVEGLRESGAEGLAALWSVPRDRLDTAGYENGWTVKQIMAHVASMEFAYRRLPELAKGAGNAPSLTDGGSFDMDAYNARQVERRAAATVEELAGEFARGRGALIADIANIDENLLTKPVRSAGGITGSLAEVIDQTAVGHVRLHSADFRRAAGSEPAPGDRAAAALVIAAEEIAILLAGASEAQWRQRATAEDWSAAGISGHLVELMPYWASAIEQLAGQPNGLLGRDINAPERIGAVSNGEATTSIRAAESIREAAAEAGLILRRIPAGVWSQPVQHQRYGEMTLGSCVDTLLVQHSCDHIRQMAAALTLAPAM